MSVRAPVSLGELLEARCRTEVFPPFAERKAVFEEIFFGPAPAYFAPGIGMVGKVPLRTYAYARNPERMPGGPAALADQLATCADTHDLDVREVLCDDCGPAPSLIDLPELMRLLLACRNGEVDAIVVEELGRLIRGGMLAPVLERLSKLNVVVFDLSIGGPIEPRDAYCYTLIGRRPSRGRSKARRR